MRNSWRELLVKRQITAGELKVRKLVITICGVGAFMFSHPSRADFSGPYAFSTFTFNPNGENGSYSTNGNSSVTIVGNNGPRSPPTFTTFTSIAPTSGNYTFNWSYSTSDQDGPTWDPAYFYLNSPNARQLTAPDGLSQTGLKSVFVNAGDIYGWSIESNDGLGGAATLIISNFSNLPFIDIIPAGSPLLASNLGVSVNPVFAGGTLQMGPNDASYLQNFTLDTSNTNIIDQYGRTSTFTGIFSNAVSGQAGKITIVPSQTQSGGEVIFSGDNTYTGLTTINAGAALQIGNGGTSGSIIGDVLNNGSFGFDRSDPLNYAGSISGSGSLTKSGSGALTLSGTNSYAGVQPSWLVL